MNLSTTEDYVRIVLVGDSSVGKTSLISRLVSGEFIPDEQSTVGAMFVLYKIACNDQSIDLQIWDTAGQEKFRSLGPIYYRNSRAGIVVFDISNAESFEHLNSWIDDFCNTTGADVLIYVVANKTDLEEKVPIKEAEIWARKRGYFFFATSALDGTGVKELFQSIGEKLIQTRTPKKVEPITLSEYEGEKDGNSCC